MMKHLLQRFQFPDKVPKLLTSFENVKYAYVFTKLPMRERCCIMLLRNNSVDLRYLRHVATNVGQYDKKVRCLVTAFSTTF